MDERGATLVKRALRFATWHHGAIGHKRKYTGRPYIEHPIAVARIVLSVDHTPAMLAAALLHDTVEDTAATIADIREHFGDDVAQLVSELTDVSTPADGNRAARKAKDRAHIAQASAAAKTVKLADLLDNAESILEHDPAFARVFLGEKAALLEVLTAGDAALHARACEVVSRGLARLAAAE